MMTGAFQLENLKGSEIKLQWYSQVIPLEEGGKAVPELRTVGWVPVFLLIIWSEKENLFVFKEVQ